MSIRLPIRLSAPSLTNYDVRHLQRMVGPILDGQTLTRGTSVEHFELQFASRVGARYAVAFSSGGAGLFAAYSVARRLYRGKWLTTTPNTFIGALNAAMLAGYKLNFVGVNRLGLGDFSLATKGVITRQHHGGVITDPLSHGIQIEDACHALGGAYPNGARVGSCPRGVVMTCFSLHPAKLITTGEGGVVTTNDEMLYTELKKVRDSGRGGPYASFALFMTELQAELGLAQLQSIENNLMARRHVAEWYDEELRALPVDHYLSVSPVNAPRISNNAHHLYQVSFSDKKYRDEVRTRLRKESIESGVHFEHHLISQQQWGANILSLPIHPGLSRSDVRRVVSVLTEKA